MFSYFLSPFPFRCFFVCVAMFCLFIGSFVACLNSLVGFGVTCLFASLVCSYSLLFMFTPSPLLSHATRATPVPTPFVMGIWDALERERTRERPRSLRLRHQEGLPVPGLPLLPTVFFFGDQAFARCPFPPPLSDLVLAPCMLCSDRATFP